MQVYLVICCSFVSIILYMLIMTMHVSNNEPNIYKFSGSDGSQIIALQNSVFHCRSPFGCHASRVGLPVPLAFVLMTFRIVLPITPKVEIIKGFHARIRFTSCNMKNVQFCLLGSVLYENIRRYFKYSGLMHEPNKSR